jgi:GT2 family glycosyltransferase
MVETRVLIVVPTLGTRLEHLNSCLKSIASQSVPAEVVIVSPINREVQAIAEKFDARIFVDPGSQTKAINAGVKFAVQNSSFEFVNWLGDDDLLEPDSLKKTTAALDANPAATVTYGACRYIDERDQELWVNSAGKWAPRLLGWGPDLIPQPGMLVRMSDWQSVGGVDESYRFAFDLDLLLRLRKLGPLVDTGTIVSSFRWHADSLTVGDRTTNLQESERAKRAALSLNTRKMAWLWERPVRGATRIAAWEVSRRARKKRA